MDSDIEVVSETWIEQMLFYASQTDVGAVGGSIDYPDGTVRHAGIVLAPRGTAHRLLHRAPADSIGYFGVLCCARDVSAITAECMMLKRTIFDGIGGFDERLSTANQAVDLCVRLRNLGLRNVFTPHARFTYLGTCGDGILHQTNATAWFDPYYNPNLSLDECDYTVKSGAGSGNR
jgi:GT2 family glycosyltransferase